MSPAPDFCCHGRTWFGLTNGPVYSVDSSNPQDNWLIITATKDLSRNHWYSGIIASVDNRAVGFAKAAPAYWECRLKSVWTNSTDGQGMWPSFWLLGADRSHNYAELDVYEAWGNAPTIAHQTWHRWGVGGSPNQGGDHTTTIGLQYSHVYGCLIQSDFIHFYIDGIEVNKVPAYPEALLPMYCMLDLAIINEGSRTSPAKMSASYIRCYAP